MTETDSTASRGFGFISFDCFESADAGGDFFVAVFQSLINFIFRSFILFIIF
jgi:hypothetical protein